jgi:hypothetical protein
MLALNAAQIGRDSRFEQNVGRLTKVVLEKHVFGGDGGVGLELEDEMAVWRLPCQQRLDGRTDCAVNVSNWGSLGGLDI